MKMPIFSALNNLRRFIHEPLNFMHELHEKNGDFSSVYLAHKKFHFACHPDFSEYILNSHADEYRKSRLIFDKIKPITGDNGLVQLEGGTWQEMRRITGEVFHKSYIDSYLDIVNQYTDELVTQLKKQIQTNPFVDISALMIRYTINIAVRIFFGIQHNDHVDKIAKKFIELNSLCGLRMRHVLPLPLLFPSKLNRQVQRARAEVKKLIAFLITHGKKSELSLLAQLSKQLKNHKHKDTLIQDQMMTFIFAGYETSAASLTFCFYLLAKHKEYQHKIRTETLATTACTLSVYRETLRLYPPAYMLAREVIHEHKLDGRILKKGENVILSLYELHRHKKIWTNANEFIPERFLNFNNLQKFAFLPFGYGKRVCSGMQLAILEAVIVLKKLLQHFQFSLQENFALQVETMVTLHPKNSIKLHVEQLC